MYYYLVAIGSNKYHGKKPLTYSFAEKLADGTLVDAPLRNEIYLGFIVGSADKPAFAAKSLSKVHYSIPALPPHLLQLFSWVQAYYPAPLGISTQLFLPKNLTQKPQFEEPKTDQPMQINTDLPPLTSEQTAAIEKIEPSGTHLIHGETGSGKTRIYIELALEAFKNGRSSIILTPEISLTTQLTQRFVNVFGQKPVTVLHSSMTAAARRKAWLHIASSTQPQIVIGARSALFCPVPSPGLIVLDESHETSYKQDNSPYYHAARVASKIAELTKAQLVLGSATPSVNDYYMAEELHRPIIRLDKPATGTEAEAKVETKIVDMRDRATTTRNTHLSNTLLDAIDYQLRNNQQTLLFLNRRGTARIVLCSNCGWQAVCPRCDLPLTYHHDTYSLRCHACSHSQTAITTCPNCGNSDITLKSIGTKTIAAAVEKIFPSAKVQRFDADNSTGNKVHENYEAIHSGAIDILVGTQLLAKGFDLPNLGLIGVINADSSLYIPDFSAQERTYQLLYQVLGRVGRGHRAGQAVIQTYSPDNPTIQSATHKEWQIFYEKELAERKAYVFPPFCHLMKASCRRSSVKSSTAAAQKVRTLLEEQRLPIAIEGPAPAFHERVQGKYTWQLVLKSNRRAELLKAISLLPKDWTYDIDPIDLL